jgi:hypothetical protein
VGSLQGLGRGEQRAASTACIRLEVARSLPELEALADAWQALEPVIPLATLQHAWVAAAVEAFGEQRSPRILLAFREMLGVREDWLRVWTADEHASPTLYCYPATTRGAHALSADASSFGRRRLARAQNRMVGPPGSTQATGTDR